MNLFAQRSGAKKASASSASVSGRMKLPWQGSVSLGAVVLGGAFLGWLFYSTQKSSEEAQKQIDGIEAQIQQMVESGQKRSLASEKQKDRRPSGLDGTWTSLIWKLSAYTTNHILIRRMDLTQSAPAAPTAAAGAPSVPAAAGVKQVILEGEAASVKALKEWLDGLLKNVPGYDFVMDQQGKGEDPLFPVKFKVTAKYI